MLKKITIIFLCTLAIINLLSAFVFAQDNTSPAEENIPAQQETQAPDEQHQNGRQRPPEGFTGTDESSEAPQGSRGGRGQGGPGGQGGFGGMQMSDNGDIPQPPEMQGWGSISQATQTQPLTETDTFDLNGFINEYGTAMISLILLALAFIFVVFYKRKTF